MSEFTELLGAYTKLKAEYDELKACADKQEATIRVIKEAAENRMDLVLDGVHYMPEEKAQIFYLPDGMRIGGMVADIVSTDVCDAR